PLRSYRPAPIIPSTSLSISNCSTASATARRKSPSPAFSSKSARTNLSSVIGSSRVLQVEVLQLHLSRHGPMATSTTPQPYTADRPENSTTSVDANKRIFSRSVFRLSSWAIPEWERPNSPSAWRHDWEYGEFRRAHSF